MNEYTFTVCLKVKVNAYDASDAKDVLHDLFDPGSDCGVEITDLEIKE